MKATEILNQVKNLLGVELSESDIQLAELKLENGTVLEADAFESGKEVFIRTEDEKVALPVGEYELEDNRLLVVEEEGIIKEIKAEEHEEDEDKEEMKYVTREEFRKEMDELKEHIDKMMDHNDKEKEKGNSNGLIKKSFYQKEGGYSLAGVYEYLIIANNSTTLKTVVKGTTVTVTS